jgi:CheY-like chemotaxis protein
MANKMALRAPLSSRLISARAGARARAIKTDRSDTDTSNTGFHSQSSSPQKDGPVMRGSRSPRAAGLVRVNGAMTKRVLIVDDEEDMRAVTQLSLEMVAGWHVLIANSGEDALVKADSELPDAILLDVMMPDMDGPQTVQRMRSNPRTRAIPIVLLTAKSQPEDHCKLSALDVSGIVMKPFDPMDLPRQIAAALGW